MSPVLSDIYWEGAMAYANGQPIAACTYRRDDRIAAWERGWKEEQQRRQDQDTTLTDADIARGKKGIAAIKAALSTEE